MFQKFQKKTYKHDYENTMKNFKEGRITLQEIIRLSQGKDIIDPFVMMQLEMDGVLSQGFCSSHPFISDVADLSQK
jgi:predicted nucleic acid-binding Zn finger protein